MSEQLKRVASDIDRLITLDINGRGVIHELYTAARHKTGGALVKAASEVLSRNIFAGSIVLIATGWPDRPWITSDIGELDGPPGAALLGRSIHRILGAVPIFLIENELQQAMRATACASGFAVLPIDQAISASKSPSPLHAASILSFPKDISNAKKESKKLIDDFDPKAVIVIEKGGINQKGVIHNARGMDTTACMAKVDELIRIAKENDIVSIGIGDGGNEIGMGLIEDAVRNFVPFGAKCACPCKAGLAPVTETDILVTSSVSNWGAYGIAACLAVMYKDSEGIHDEAMEMRTLREAADAGLIDGNTGYVDPGADGIPAVTHAAIITILRQIVANAVSPYGLALQSKDIEK